MTYIRAVIVGIIVAVAVAVLWVFGNLFVPIYVEQLVCWLRPNCYAGGAASTVGSGSTLLVMLAGFGVGLYWSLRRSGRRQVSVSK